MFLVFGKNLVRNFDVIVELGLSSILDDDVASSIEQILGDVIL